MHPTLCGIVEPFDSHIDICGLYFTKFGIEKNICFSFLKQNSETTAPICLKLCHNMSKIMQWCLLGVLWP